jgi:cell division protein FtsN
MRSVLRRGIQFIKSSRRNSLIAVLAALIVVMVGFALFHALASSFFAPVEPEDGTLTSNAKIIRAYILDRP